MPVSSCNILVVLFDQGLHTNIDVCNSMVANAASKGNPFSIDSIDELCRHKSCINSLASLDVGERQWKNVFVFENISDPFLQSSVCCWRLLDWLVSLLMLTHTIICSPCYKHF